VIKFIDNPDLITKELQISNKYLQFFGDQIHRQSHPYFFRPYVIYFPETSGGTEEERPSSPRSSRSSNGKRGTNLKGESGLHLVKKQKELNSLLKCPRIVIILLRITILGHFNNKSHPSIILNYM
jgi:ATP adenylyltransferase/5',5'''-P-1,P-4-tetraphosphate phosphorylase II